METQKIKTIWLLLVLLTFSCDDQITLPGEFDNTNSINAGQHDIFNRWHDSGAVAPAYDGNDSGPIDNDIAAAWINNYHKANGRSATGMYYFSKQAMDNILSQEGCTGIRVYYAINREDQTTLIISGVDGNGQNILGEDPLLLAAQETSTPTGGIIGYREAQSWIVDFQSVIDPTEIKSHYFGETGIHLVLNQATCKGLKIYQALNDNGEQKLLIVGIGSAGALGSARVASSASVE